MIRPKSNSNVGGTLFGLAAVALLVAVIWIVFTGNNGAISRGQSPQATNVALATVSNVIPASEIATSDQNATDDAAATIVALKLTDAIDRIIVLTTTPRPTPVVGATGISEDEYQKLELAKLGLNVENGFGGYVDGNGVGVWAGSLFSDPDQGFVLVIWVYPYRTLEQRFLSAEKHGSLRIKEEHNNRLTLIARDGATLYFDIPGLQFVSSLTETVPTITPPPTYTPPSPRPASRPPFFSQ